MTAIALQGRSLWQGGGTLVLLASIAWLYGLSSAMRFADTQRKPHFRGGSAGKWGFSLWVDVGYLISPLVVM